MGVGEGMGEPPQPPLMRRLRPLPDLLDLHRGQTWANLIRLVVRLDLLSLRLFCLLCLRVAIIHIDEIIYYTFQKENEKLFILLNYLRHLHVIKQLDCFNRFVCSIYYPIIDLFF